MITPQMERSAQRSERRMIARIRRWDSEIRFAMYKAKATAYIPFPINYRTYQFTNGATGTFIGKPDQVTVEAVIAMADRLIKKMNDNPELFRKPKVEPGFVKGEVCGRDGCQGIIEEHEKDGGCTCFINPPCSYCVEPCEFCPECDWQASDEQ